MLSRLSTTIVAVRLSTDDRPTDTPRAITAPRGGDDRLTDLRRGRRRVGR